MNNNPNDRNLRRARRKPNMKPSAGDTVPSSAPVVRRPVPQRPVPQPVHANAAPAARRTKKKQIPLFYLIYASCIVLVLAGLAVGVVVLRAFLTEYESAQPIHIAEDVFQTYFSDPDYQKLTKYFSAAEYTEKYQYESEADTIDAMNQCVKGKKMSFFKAATDLESSIEYSVTADNVKIATIRLCESGKTTKHGYPLYQLETIKLYDVIGYSRSQNQETTGPDIVEIKFTFIAPSNYRISVDGTELTAEQIAKTTYDTETLRKMPADYQGIPYTEYTVMLEEPPQTVSAIDSNGDTAEAQYDDKTYTYTFAFVYDKQLESEYSSYAIEAAQKLAAYMQAGLRFDDIAKYYDPSSQLYSDTRAIGADAWMVNKYDSMEFKDVQCGEFYRYSDTSFACRVSMIQIGHRAGYEDSTDPIDYMFFFRLVDGTYLMYERYNN